MSWSSGPFGEFLDYAKDDLIKKDSKYNSLPTYQSSFFFWDNLSDAEWMTDLDPFQKYKILEINPKNLSKSCKCHVGNNEELEKIFTKFKNSDLSEYCLMSEEVWETEKIKNHCNQLNKMAHNYWKSMIPYKTDYDPDSKLGWKSEILCECEIPPKSIRVL